jgi:hypothetical protein
MATDEEKLVYSKLLERICSDIKAIDRSHPITSIEAWSFGMDWWSKYVPSVDIYGLNSYGAGANYLAEEMQKRNIDKPYIVTEFGVTGEWDVAEDKNGVKVEPSDAEKYDAIVNGYSNWIVNKANCLGVYVFHYNSGNSFGDIWLATHVDNKYRPQYWAIREAYTGYKPTNYVPEISRLELPEATVEAEDWVPVTLTTTDKENETLNVTFGYNHRVGSRRYRNQILPLNTRGNIIDGFEIQLPEVNGAIKVYAFVSDAYSNLGIESISIMVKDDDAIPDKYRVPKVDLPFYIYKDNETLPYLPTGYMGNYKTMSVDLNHTKNVHSGKSAIEISYKDRSGWYGLSFVDPANDWGDILGGYNISGAKTFSFWAKADFSGIGAKIGFGLIEKGKPFPDSAIASEEIVLTSKWKKYSIKLKKMDLSNIKTGFVIFSNGYGSSHKIYLDNIVFE